MELFSEQFIHPCLTITGVKKLPCGIVTSRLEQVGGSRKLKKTCGYVWGGKLSLIVNSPMS